MRSPAASCTNNEVNHLEKKIEQAVSEQIAAETLKKPHPTLRIAGALIKTVVTVAAVAVSVAILANMLLIMAGGGSDSIGGITGAAIMDRFDMFMTNQVSNALDGVLNIEKAYWLSDADLVAPKPKQENFGAADSAEELAWLIEEAAPLLDGQELLFGPERPIWPDDQIYYYYDETILVLTWKELRGNTVYTISEVKIAHPSQFRRFLADGEFGSDKQYVTTEMAQSVNAVVASSGDFYKHRYYGVVVHEREIKRSEFEHVETCYINDDGDLLFSHKGQFASEAEAQEFVDANNIRFSLAFGPILIENGVNVAPAGYMLGEIDGTYSRMALCQKDDLHYLLVNATAEYAGHTRINIWDFTKNLETFDCDMAYTLDGGQTTVITMQGETINHIDYEFQRQISDIIYFATALPDGE